MGDRPECIRRVNTIEEAQILVAWLDEQDVKATIVGESNPGSMAFGVTDFEGIGIFVADASAAERARRLLAEHDAHGPQSEPAEDLVEVTCEECGESATFRRDDAGTVQTCPGCGANLDVPGDTVSA